MGGKEETKLVSSLFSSSKWFSHSVYYNNIIVCIIIHCRLL